MFRQLGLKITCATQNIFLTRYWAGGFYDYNPLAISAFQQWLAIQYDGSIAQLNNAWAPSGAPTYTSFAEIQPPTIDAGGNQCNLDW